MVVNHVLELVCEADGIPLPTLTWLKDGRPLPQTDSIRLLRDGEVLRVASAQVKTTNVVSKWAVPLMFLSFLPCCSMCHKHDMFLNHVLTPIFVQVENTGRYTCLATSPAGDDDKEFLVRVHGET